MNEIVRIDNSEVKTVNSREIASMVGMMHKNLIQKIESHLKSFNQRAEISAEHYFLISSYLDSNRVSRKCYELTKMGCEVICNSMSGDKGNIFRALYVKKFHEMEEALKPKGITMQMTDTFKATKTLLLEFGISNNSALISASNHMEDVHGINPIKVLHIELPEEKQDSTYTPTELGKMLPNPVSAMKMNKILGKKGYQAKIDRRWVPTDEGKKHCKIIDTGKKHSSGAPVEQIKWYKSAIN